MIGQLIDWLVDILLFDSDYIYIVWSVPACNLELIPVTTSVTVKSAVTQ